MDITKSSLNAASLRTGAGVVGTSAVKVTGVGHVGLARGVTVSANPDNSNALYVGGANVGASNGFRLKAGQTQKFEVDSSDGLFIVGGASGQNYSWAAQ